MDADSRTSVSLLLQLRLGERQEDAWHQFVERYGTRIYQWCLNRRLQPNDAEDVTQNVLVKLARYLQDFDYDPSSSFRGWLRRVTENALNDFFRERDRRICHSPPGAPDNGMAMLEQAQAREELLDRLQQVFDMELLREAVRLVRQRVNPDRFRAWELTANQGLSGAEVGRLLKMKIATVYTARNQVQKLIQQEIRTLEGSDDSSQS